MSRLLLSLLVVGALLVATNPSRSDFNAWAQTYVVKKIEEETRRRGENPNDGSAQIGGAIAGFVISNMPVERRNFLAFSIYAVRFPDDKGGEKNCSILALVGQFVPLGGC